MIRHPFIVLFSLVVAAALAACELDGGAYPQQSLAPVAAPPAATEYQILQARPDRLLVELPNRLLVVAQELKTAPVVTAQVWVKTGSIYEQEHVGAGLSHFLEHLVSGGTTATRSEAESNAILGRIGAQTNAGTGLATVQYYVNTTAEHTAEAIDLISDWMLNSVISDDEYVRERDVIQREFQMGQGDPGRIFWKLTQKARYRYHPARHPTIGYLDEFLQITRDEIHAFYKRMYVPNNMLFVVVGDVDKQKVVDQIARLWSDAPPSDMPPLQFPVEPPIDGPRQLEGTADVRKARLRLAWPGTRLGEDGDYALDLMAVIFGQGESSRLVRTIRDEQRLVNTIGAFNLSMHWGDGFVSVDCEIAADNGDDQAVGRVKDAILEQVEQLRIELVSQQELARAQRQTRARTVYGAQTAQGMAGHLADGLISMHDPDYRRRYADAVQTITREQIRDAARRFLAPQRLITVSLKPLEPGTEPPKLARPDDETVPPDLKREAVELDNAAIHRDLASSADTAALRAIRTDPVRRVVLPNGLRLLVERSTAVPAVSIQFYQLGGLLADAPGREGVANATARMLIRGTTTRSAEDIARLVDDLGASLVTTCGNNTQYTQALCLAEDWQRLMELTADVLLNPAFDAGEWQKLQPRLVASIDRIQDRWSGELAVHFRNAYYSNHPWSHTVQGRRDVVAELTAEDLSRFHHDRLNASQSVLAVFGDVDPDDVVQQVQHLFQDMPKTSAELFEAPGATDPAVALHAFETQKPLAAVQIGFGPGATRRSPDYAALRVMGNVMSDFPSGWLHQALRGSEGLAYAVWAYSYVGLSPGYFTVVFNTKPQTIGESLSRSIQVVQRARTELVDGESLQRAKARVLTDEFFGKQTNSDRAQELALAELYGLGLDEPQRFLQRVKHVDADQLRQIARKYLNNPVTVVISHEAAPRDQLEALVQDFAAGAVSR